MKFRNRKCSSSACGGSCSGNSLELQKCDACCPVNGRWTAWTSWTECTVSCGGGTQIRSRHCTGSRCGGTCTGKNVITQTCNNDDCCPVNGKWAAWSDWSKCIGTCSKGVKFRNRICSGSACGGSCSGNSLDLQKCDTCCPVNGRWTAWTSWTECTVSCGGGTRNRSRHCSGSRCGGTCTGKNVITQTCNNDDCCPVNGTWSDWSDWSECSTTCGAGIQHRHRNCTKSKCGNYCTGSETERRVCSTICCPRNGTWTNWTDWTDCSVSCGGGSQNRSRTCRGHSCGGYCDGLDHETRDCNTDCCPINGTWTDWSDWSTCPVTCGTGIQSRHRNCTDFECGGYCDGPESETQLCNTDCCPVNGNWTEWEAWTDCSVVCGGGTQNRSRTCHGYSCGGYCEGLDYESQSCNTECCPVNGTWSDWSDWSDCPVTCGASVQYRNRNCTNFTCGGYCTGPETESQLCNTNCCPGNGTWTGWSDWSTCPVTCGTGSQSRHRNCTDFECGGYCDGPESETQLCNTDCCPVNGSWTEWEEWTDCSVVCGGGTQNRSRNCHGYSCGGYCEGLDYESQSCNTECCPVNGTWSDWSDWSECPVTCGTGVQYRNRNCTNFTCGGYCTGPETESQLCNTNCCPGNGTWTGWSDWSTCPVTCGTGSQSRHRNCTDFECGGYCDGPESETQLCNTDCCPVNGSWTEWEEWTDCSVVCGGGTQNRSRNCHGYSCGGYCEGLDYESQSCNTECCPVNGTWSDWSDWSECPVTCGTGVQYRNRNCTNFTCGGYCTGPETESQLCNTNCCPGNGTWTGWSDWSTCPVMCGTGSQSRHRNCTDFECGGYCDGPESETQLCNTDCCPVNGNWTEWEAWTDCSVVCGGGTQNRSRTCHGYSCGGYCEGLDYESQSCNTECCPVNGTWSDWSDWSDCPVTCGTGVQYRNRNCTNFTCGGYCTGPETESQLCNTNCCPGNGTWTGWSDWSTCPVTCGTGIQSRHRNCTEFECGGYCNGPDSETQFCNTGCCPVNGNWTEWTEWTNCSVVCGGGTQNRSRVCLGHSCGGYCEGLNHESKSCNEECCPVNGTWADWADWSACTVTCGRGTQVRHRNCIDSECGGSCDGTDLDTRSCNTDCCLVNGSWTEWSNWTTCTATCGGGMQNRTRQCTGFSCGGFCDGEDVDERQCNKECCPQDGVWTGWSEWSQCVNIRGRYTQNRRRDCIDISCGGQYCRGASSENQTCDPPYCLGKQIFGFQFTMTF